MLTTVLSRNWSHANESYLPWRRTNELTKRIEALEVVNSERLTIAENVRRREKRMKPLSRQAETFHNSVARCVLTQPKHVAVVPRLRSHLKI